MEKKFCSFILWESMFIYSSGTRSVLPMGVAPEAIVEYLYSSIGSKDSCTYCDVIPAKTMLPFILFSSGACSALPMGVAPGAMMGCLQPIIVTSRTPRFFLSPIS
jgi:hypothetical protein